MLGNLNPLHKNLNATQSYCSLDLDMNAIYVLLTDQALLSIKFNTIGKYLNTVLFKYIK